MILCKNVATDIKTVLYVVIGRYSPSKITKKSQHRNFDVKNGMAWVNYFAQENSKQLIRDAFQCILPT